MRTILVFSVAMTAAAVLTCAGSSADAKPKKACAAGSTAAQAQSNMQRQETATDIGGQIGGMLGGAAGRRLGLGSGDGRRLGRSLGKQAGLAAAGPLTAGLDECDKQWVTNSTEQTLETSKPSSWEAESGASGQNKIVKTDPAILERNPGKVCRTVQQQITLADGSGGVQNLTACKGADGAWEPVA